MFSTSQSETIENKNQLLSQVEQSIESSLTPPATTASNNSEQSGSESTGIYVNWGFDNNEEFYFIPYSELKIMIMKLENLDVTVKTQKAEGMNLISQLISKSKSIIVTKNRRFPLSGHYYNTGCRSSSKFKQNSLQKLYNFLQNIDNDCVDINFYHSKSVIFNVFAQITEDKGLIKAYDYAVNHFAFPIKSPQSHLDKYLKYLCCFVHMDKDGTDCWFSMFNVTSFEAECGLTWEEIEE